MGRIRTRPVSRERKNTTSVALSFEQVKKLEMLQKALRQSTQSDVIRILIDCAEPTNLPPVVFSGGGAE